MNEGKQKETAWFELEYDIPGVDCGKITTFEPDVQKAEKILQSLKMVFGGTFPTYDLSEPEEEDD